MASPFDQLGLAGAGREPAERVDGGPHDDLLAEDPHFPRPVDEPPFQRALRLEPTISTATLRRQRLCRRWWTMRPLSQMPVPARITPMSQFLFSALDSAAVSVSRRPLSSWRKGPRRIIAPASASNRAGRLA